MQDGLHFAAFPVQVVAERATIPIRARPEMVDEIGFPFLGPDRRRKEGLHKT
jgi:hypothetical protein